MPLRELLDAVWQILDDMGENGTNCSLAAKAQLRLAYETWREPELELDMSVEQAKRILIEAGML